MAGRCARRGEAFLPLILRRDRLPALVGMIGVTVLAWLYLFWLAAGMRDTGGGMAGDTAPCRRSGMSAGGMAGRHAGAARLERRLSSS